MVETKSIAWRITYIVHHTAAFSRDETAPARIAPHSPPTAFAACPPAWGLPSRPSEEEPSAVWVPKKR